MKRTIPICRGSITLERRKPTFDPVPDGGKDAKVKHGPFDHTPRCTTGECKP